MEWTNFLNNHAASEIRRAAEELGVLPLPVEIVAHTGESHQLHPGMIGGSVVHNYEIHVKLNSGYIVIIKDNSTTSSAMSGMLGKSLRQQVEDLIKAGASRLIEEDKRIKAAREEWDEITRRSKMSPEEVFIEKHSK